MTGPEHYREAERLLEPLDQTHSDFDREQAMRAAQVHATLALAAATAMATVSTFMGDDDQITAWGKALGWKRALDPGHDLEFWDRPQPRPKLPVDPHPF